MTLVKLTSDQALENAKTNALNSWPTRDTEGNRVEPYCSPGFRPSFQLVPKESIFTIGSCFARNVEAQLERLGFAVPMRHIQVTTEAVLSTDPENNPNIFNNYSAPSILNELEWALDPTKSFDPESCLVEISGGNYCDLHLSRFLKAVPLKDAVARRERIKTSMATIRDCRVVIITLGLVEAWFDHKAGRYLNIAPPRQAAKREPDRFELHVLSHNEIVDVMERIVALLKQYCRPDHRIVLTVSPIPLGLTFTDQDVIVANSYSKAVLRCAAQEMWLKYDHVDYFPSYEAIVTSARDVTWQDDLRHVTPESIANNVNRMVDAYIGRPHDTDLMSEAASLQKAGRLRDAAEIYERVIDLQPGANHAALALGRCRGGLGEISAAETVLMPLLKIPRMRADAALALSNAYRVGKDDIGFKRIETTLEEMDDAKGYRELVIGNFEFARHDHVLKHCDNLERVAPRSFVPAEYRGRVALAQGRPADAERFFAEALSMTHSLPQLHALLGKAQFDLGKRQEAKESYDRALELNPRTNLALAGLAELGVGRPSPESGPDEIASGAPSDSLPKKIAAGARRLMRTGAGEGRT